MSHTPGPWSVSADRISSDHGDIAAIHYQSSREQKGWLCMNDASLISAAPDLLAACQTVAHDLQAALDGDDFSGMPDAELFRAFLDVLRPAIAKAEGRTDETAAD